MTAVQSSLPQQFYDLQYSFLDIDEALRQWANKTSLVPEDRLTEARSEFGSNT